MILDPYPLNGSQNVKKQHTCNKNSFIKLKIYEIFFLMLQIKLNNIFVNISVQLSQQIYTTHTYIKIGMTSLMSKKKSTK